MAWLACGQGQVRIKSLMTAIRHSVNAKYEPVVEETNRLKCIFTSNHPDAVYMTDADRRFYVVEANGSRQPTAGITEGMGENPGIRVKVRYVLGHTTFMKGSLRSTDDGVFQEPVKTL
jgi:hypothetical protein